MKNETRKQMSQSANETLQRIDAELKQAMRDKDEVTKLTLRSLKTALTEARKATGQNELDEEAVMAVIQREAKRRRDAAEAYEQAGRTDLADKERAELAVLAPYLPQQLTDEELEEVAREVIAEVGATSMRNMNIVMSTIMPRVTGRADGKRVSQTVRQLLSK